MPAIAVFIIVFPVLAIIAACIETKGQQSAQARAEYASAAAKAARDADRERRAEEARRRTEARQAVQLEIAREKRRAAELSLEARKLERGGAPAPAPRALKAPKAVKAPSISKYTGIDPVPCMLARKLSDRPEAVTGQAFTITEKLDGVRCVSIVRAGSVEMFTRGGAPIEGCAEILPELSRLPEGMYDGELLPLRRPGVTAAENFKEAARIVRTWCITFSTCCPSRSGTSARPPAPTPSAAPPWRPCPPPPTCGPSRPSTGAQTPPRSPSNWTPSGPRAGRAS